MKRLAWTLALMVSAANTIACSDDSSGDGGDASGGGTTGGSSSGGSATGGSATGGSSGSVTGGMSGASTGGSTTGGAAGSGMTGGSSTGGSGGGSGTFTSKGSCGQKTIATVTETEYSGTEEFYMVSKEVLDEGLREPYVCHIRFDVARVGEAPPGCADLDGVECLWTHKVEIKNPTVVVNVDNACEKNDRRWDAAWMAEMDGTQTSLGYVDMYEGHASTILQDFGPAGAPDWEVVGVGTWTADTGELTSDIYSDCRY
jgi:hypothetical protein